MIAHFKLSGRLKLQVINSCARILRFWADKLKTVLVSAPTELYAWMDSVNAEKVSLASSVKL